MIASAYKLDGYLGTAAKPRRPRQELADAFTAANGRRRELSATYDAARTTDEFKNYWANADSFDADSANSRAVRSTLVPRSRYEIGSNGYADGIASTYATDLVGIGPTLRMQSGSEGFNALVERTWFAWAKAIMLRRKLWCMAHAKHSDGEGFGVVRRNPGILHPLKIDLRLYETEQFQTPLLPYDVEGRIDGIRFDAAGNPTVYELLQSHPGSNIISRLDLTPEEIPAKFVCHWFKMRRPGQHRGIPENTSSLNCGAAFRRFREATIAKAETQADFTLFLKTLYEPDELDIVTPMSTLDIQKRMMTALPNSVEPVQLQSNTPGAQYEAFHKTLINEQARPKSMPFNKAACDSSSYNYASGRLDHQTYYAALDVEREDCNDLVLDPLFRVWFELAVMQFGWLGGDVRQVSDAAFAHTWDWPKHLAVDIEAEASSNDKRLKNGTSTLPQVYSEDGQDYEDVLQKQALSNGITVQQQRQLNMLVNMPQHVIPFAAQLLGIQQNGGAADVQTATA